MNKLCFIFKLIDIIIDFIQQRNKSDFREN